MKNQVTLNISQEKNIIRMKKLKMPNSIIIRKYKISENSIYNILKRDGRIHNVGNKKYEVNENYFEKIDNEEKAYWLGFLYADGNVRLHKNKSGILKLKLKQSDRQHIEKFNNCIGSNYIINDGLEILKVKEREYKCYYSVLCIYNTKLVKDLFNFGCVENKTQKILLPLLNDKLMPHFIRGYFDGDGCINKVKKYYNSYSISIFSNSKFILELKEMFNNIFNDNLKEYESENKMFSTLIISDRENREKFYNYIYGDSTIYLERKKKIFDNMMIIKDDNRKGKVNIKKYKIINPDGVVFITNNGLSSFCRNNNLNLFNLTNVLSGLVKHYKGWKVEKYN